MEDQRNVLVFLNDLMFQVKIAEAARHANVSTAFVDSEMKLLARVAKARPGLIILDINLLNINPASADPLKVIRDLKASTDTRTIPLVGYVSHVQTELRAAASEAGCDTVLARSAFVQKLPELLAQYGSPLTST